jgi:hypothetical protein
MHHSGFAVVTSKNYDFRTLETINYFSMISARVINNNNNKFFTVRLEVLAV